MTLKNQVYPLLTLLCLLAYAWLFYLFFHSHDVSSTFTPCIIKNVTGFACPSCGISRALLLLFNGDFYSSIKTNPLAIIVALIMFIMPFLIVYDLLFKQKILLQLNYKFEALLKKPLLAIPLILLVLCNWIWNIFKDL